MYAHSIPADKAGVRQTDLDYSIDDRSDIAYWRKFNALHGWMRQLYYDKKGTDPDFNCNTVRLEAEDLNRLETEAKAKTLAPTAGFFFGDSSTPFDDNDCQMVLDFVVTARQSIADGFVVVYSSWW